MLLGTNLVINKSLSIFPSFKVVNVIKNDAQLFLRCVVSIDHLSRQCSYAVHNTTIE